MKTKTLMTILAFLLLTSCGTLPPLPAPAPSDVVPSGEVEAPAADIPQVGMANPASVYCVEQGYRSEIRTAADGSQYGVCVFPDGSECDEWAFFRKECEPGQPVTAVPDASTQEAAVSGDFIVPQMVSIPAGVIVDPRNGSTGMTGSVVFYAPDGLMLGEMSAPYADKLHAAGAYQGALDFPLVFHAFDTETRTQTLKVNRDEQVTDILSMSDIAIMPNLVGVPGDPTLFYAVFQPVNASLQTQFFFGAMDSLSTAAPVLTLESVESRYWKPVAIQMKDGTAKGLWFTREPWGIGGDIVFEYQEGLSYLDLSSGQVAELITPTFGFSSLSPDQTWVAYNARKEGGSSDFFIRNLSSGGEPLLIPPLLESDRGAGDGFFSPSNHYIAWREAQGSLYEGNFHSTIRIATLDGQVVNNFADTAFLALFQSADFQSQLSPDPQTAQTLKVAIPQFGEGTQILPAGWLDNETFLVQAVSPDKERYGVLVKVNAVTGEMAFFANGYFAGWLYP